MKKIICVLTAFIMLMSFAACSDEAVKNDGPEKDNSPVSEQENKKEPDNKTEPDEPATEEIMREINPEEAKIYLTENFNSVIIDGSTSMIPLHQSLSDKFGSEENIQHSKTVDAFEKLISGENDILLSVDFSNELLQKAKNSGVDLVQIPITREAFIFIINVENPVTDLTTEQIKGIYSGEITNWSEVGGENEPIIAYQRNSDSGSQMRMVKFMDDIPLTKINVTYIDHMGHVIEQVGNYDIGKQTIAYNMYTFTENQYFHEQVMMLNVNGVRPNDETIFNETYPLVIYNYLYYNKNNALAAEFAENLYAYLMSDEGQKLISNSGYVNLNNDLDRNKNVYAPYMNESNSEIGFYNAETGEYYAVEYDENYENGKLVIFNSYPEYMQFHLRDYYELEYNEKAWEFLELIADVMIHTDERNPHPGMARIAYSYEEGYSDIISLTPWFNAVLDPEDFFSFKFNDTYYANFKYYINEDKYTLETYEKEYYDTYMSYEHLSKYSEYTKNYVPDTVIEITPEDFKNIWFRTFDYDYYEDYENKTNIELNYFQPLK